MSAAARDTLRICRIGVKVSANRVPLRSDEGYNRTQPADRVDAEVPLASLWPVLRWRIDLPAHEDVVDRLGEETRRQDRTAPENASRPSALSTNAAPPGLSRSSASATMGTKPEVNTRA